MFNNQKVIGVRAAASDGAVFERNHIVRKVKQISTGATIWNDQQVRGVFVITDDRTIWNDLPVLPVVGLAP